MPSGHTENIMFVNLTKETTIKEEVPPEQSEGRISQEEPQVLEEIVVEELSIDGICGVY